MDMEVRAAAICCICHCSVDIEGDYCIVDSQYAHRDCAIVHDSKDLGSIDLPDSVFCWSDAEDNNDEETHEY